MVTVTRSTTASSSCRCPHMPWKSLSMRVRVAKAGSTAETSWAMRRVMIQVAKEIDSQLPGWQPKENRPNCRGVPNASCCGSDISASSFFSMHRTTRVTLTRWWSRTFGQCMGSAKGYPASGASWSMAWCHSNSDGNTKRVPSRGWLTLECITYLAGLIAPNGMCGHTVLHEAEPLKDGPSFGFRTCKIDGTRWFFSAHHWTNRRHGKVVKFNSQKHSATQRCADCRLSRFSSFLNLVRSSPGRWGAGSAWKIHAESSSNGSSRTPSHSWLHQTRGLFRLRIWSRWSCWLQSRRLLIPPVFCSEGHWAIAQSSCCLWQWWWTRDCSLEPGRQRQKKTFKGGVNTLSLFFFPFLCNTPRLHGRVWAALLSIDVKWNEQVWKAQRQIHCFRCTEPRNWNDLFNDLVELKDKPSHGDDPAGTGPSRKIVDHYSFLDLTRIHFHRRTQSRNPRFHRCWHHSPPACARWKSCLALHPNILGTFWRTVPLLGGVSTLKLLVSVNSVRAVCRTPEHQPIERLIMPYAFVFDTLLVPDSAKLFTAWVSSDRQAALYARICASVSLKAYTFFHGIWLRGGTSSPGTWTSLVVVLPEVHHQEHYEPYERSLSPLEATGIWPWRVACCMDWVAEHQACSVLVKYGPLLNGSELTHRGPARSFNKPTKGPTQDGSSGRGRPTRELAGADPRTGFSDRYTLYVLTWTSTMQCRRSVGAGPLRLVRGRWLAHSATGEALELVMRRGYLALPGGLPVPGRFRCVSLPGPQVQVRQRKVETNPPKGRLVTWTRKGDEGEPKGS